MKKKKIENDLIYQTLKKTMNEILCYTKVPESDKIVVIDNIKVTIQFESKKNKQTNV